MKVLSLFSGIGAFEKALKNIEQPFELVGFCEVNKYAAKSYSAIHGVSESLNFGDITKIDEKTLPKGIDLVTYGFPCQDISIAGEQKGLFNNDGALTRSGLFFEALRIIEETKPKIAIAENVKNLTGKRFEKQFEIILTALERAGYNNYWQVLNAKDFGIPQNRERVFIVSIRKDIDTGEFVFPVGFPLALRLADILEPAVDEKYYLPNVQIEKLHINPTVAPEPTGKINMIGMLDIKGNEQVRRVYGTDGVYPTLNTMQGGNRQPKVAVAMRGRYNAAGQVEQNIEVSEREYANALTTVQKDSMIAEPTGENFRIRKLTPKECFRLMGFTDDDFAKAEAVNSNTQLYKQAGNSIVVDVLVHIFTKLKGVF